MGAARLVDPVIHQSDSVGSEDRPLNPDLLTEKVLQPTSTLNRLHLAS
jgi:hypothetical protein